MSPAQIDCRPVNSCVALGPTHAKAEMICMIGSTATHLKGTAPFSPNVIWLQMNLRKLSSVLGSENTSRRSRLLRPLHHPP